MTKIKFRSAVSCGCMRSREHWSVYWKLMVTKCINKASLLHFFNLLLQPEKRMSYGRR